MKFVLFAVFLSADLLLLFGVAFSIFFPKSRIWPPPRKNSWQFWTSWIFSAIGMIGVPLVGIFDLETLGYLHWSHFLIGGLMIAIGGSFALWGTLTLSAHQSLGLRGKLVATGPYQYTRNPQYVGFILLYAGVILATSSFMALVTGTFVVFVFVILPFSEEPWLQQQYGKQYEEYCKNVPRFIGLRSLRPKKVKTFRTAISNAPKGDTGTFFSPFVSGNFPISHRKESEECRITFYLRRCQNID